MARKAPDLSVVVIGYKMDRELPRTLRRCRRRCSAASALTSTRSSSSTTARPEPMALVGTRAWRAGLVPPSPTLGLARRRGEFRAETGARPADRDDGRWRAARLAGAAGDGAARRKVDERPIIASLGFHLGFARQMESVRAATTRPRRRAARGRAMDRGRLSPVRHRQRWLGRRRAGSSADRGIERDVHAPPHVARDRRARRAVPEPGRRLRQSRRLSPRLRAAAVAAGRHAWRGHLPSGAWRRRDQCDGARQAPRISRGIRAAARQGFRFSPA